MDEINEANELFLDGAYDEALEMYEKVLTKLPGDDKERVSVLAKKSNCYLKLGDAHKAKEVASEAVQCSTEPHAIALWRLGESHLALSEYKEAVEKWRWAAAATGVESASSTTSNVTAPLPHFRYEWFQSNTHITIELFIKKKERSGDADVKFKANEVIIDVPLVNDTRHVLHLHLYSDIVAPESRVDQLTTKIEIRMKKKVEGKWGALEAGDAAAAVATAAAAAAAAVTTTPSSSTTTSTSSSKKREKNWDQLVKEVDVEEKPQGDAALDALFKQIYKDGTDEQRRAMMKSFQESGGTVLSTNWEDVGKRKVEIQPPDGVEPKKWE